MLTAQVLLGIFAVCIVCLVHQTQAQVLSENCNATSCGSNGKCEYYQCTFGIECSCNAGYKSFVRGCVLANKKIGENCTSLYECTAADASCTYVNSRRQCVCPTGYTESTDKTYCIAIKLDTACTVQNSCGRYATCRQSKCQCEPGYKPTGDGTNCTHLLPGDTCRNTTECQNENCHGGTCKTGSFECLSGLKWYTTSVSNIYGVQNGECVPGNSITGIGGGSYCGSSQSSSYFYCTPGTECNVCPEDYRNTDRRQCIGNGAIMTSFSYMGLILACILSTYITAL